MRLRAASIPIAAAAAMLLAAVPARAEMEIVGEGPGSGQGSVPCDELNNRAREATLVIRQHASALSLGFEADARSQALVLLAWLDQWTGRLRGLVDVAEFSECLDEGDAETYRRALVTAARVGNQAREEILRVPPPAAARRRRP